MSGVFGHKFTCRSATRIVKMFWFCLCWLCNLWGFSFRLFLSWEPFLLNPGKLCAGIAVDSFVLIAMGADSVCTKKSCFVIPMNHDTRIDQHTRAHVALVLGLLARIKKKNSCWSSTNRNHCHNGPEAFYLDAF